MSRHRSFFVAIARAQRASVRYHNAQVRQQQRTIRDAERQRKANERMQLANEKEKAHLYVESQLEKVSEQNHDLEQDLQQLQSLLMSSLSETYSFSLDSLKKKLEIPSFAPGKLAKAEKEPLLEDFMPSELGIMKFIPGMEKKHAEKVEQAQIQFKKEHGEYEERETQRKKQLEEAKQQYDNETQKIKEDTENKNNELEKLKVDFENGTADAVTQYFSFAFESLNQPDEFPHNMKVAYVPESKQLVVEYELPSFDTMPTIASYKYVKANDKIIGTPTSDLSRKTLYASVIAQDTLRLLNILFKLDSKNFVESLVLNGFVNTIDKGTGQPVQPYLVTLRTTKDTFNKIDLSKVDPATCLKALNASVSRSPSDLAPVKPVLEFNMVDPRFIQETDVLSGLDKRPNLMELTPGEFESLITNLFTKMGLETRLTQPSRDGGVDCVAYDPRPIFGGKVVIQAKRYKNTVGVSAVRDLYGTVLNEGASKGILITTSGFGKASFDFADGKPLELLAGSNLLYLLTTHTGIDAVIKPPDDWKDPEGLTEQS